MTTMYIALVLFFLINVLSKLLLSSVLPVLVYNVSTLV